MTREKHSQFKHTVKLVYNEHGAMTSQLPGANSTSKSIFATFPYKHFMYKTTTLHGYITQTVSAQHHLICGSHTL